MNYYVIDVFQRAFCKTPILYKGEIGREAASRFFSFSLSLLLLFFNAVGGLVLVEGVFLLNIIYDFESFNHHGGLVSLPVDCICHLMPSSQAVVLCGSTREEKASVRL